MTRLIQIYEHQKLLFGDQFKEHHRDALFKLNELHSFNYLEAVSGGVRFKNYVGIVQIDGLCIEILPKIDNVSATKDQWRNVLVEMLRVSRQLQATDTNYADVKKKNYNLLEIYLELFLREVESLIRRGLCKQYRKQTANTLALKGKLEMAGHIRYNLVHKERFYTTHQVYDVNHEIHRIIRCALDIVGKLANGSYLASYAGRVSLDFPDLKYGKVTKSSFDNIVYSRKTAGYKRAVALAQVIIENFSPSISAGSTNMIALLFNMDQLWESFIYHSLRQYSLQQQDFTVSYQNSKQLFTSKGYLLKPDIVITRGEGSAKQHTILDTKWKVPKKKKASSSDLRQIYAYNRYWKAEKGILLYPGTDDVGEWLTYQDQHDEAEVKCKLAFVDLLEDGVLRANVGKKVVELLGS